MERTFVVLFTAAFLDLCGVGMMTMQLSSHLRQLGASHTAVGYIGSLYGFVQLLSSPLVGKYADKHSKKVTLLVCLSMCSIGYLFLGAVTNLFVIGIIRVYLGIFKHPLNLIQSSLSDLTKGQSSNQESQALGYYQSACSLAFIVSPPIAGYLMQTEDGYFKIGLCVFVIYLVNTALIFLYLPQDGESNKSDNSKDKAKSKASLPSSTIDNVSLILIMSCRLLLGITGHLWRFSYSLMYREMFHLTPAQTGWLISFNGVIQTLIGSQMKYISVIVSSRIAQLLISCLISAVTMVTVSNVPDLTSLYLVIAFMSTSTMLGKVSLQSYTTLVLGKHNTGYLVGISGTVMSSARLITPLFAGHLMQHFGISVTLYCGAVCTLLALAGYVIVHYRYTKKNKIKSE